MRVVICDAFLDDCKKYKEIFEKLGKKNGVYTEIETFSRGESFLFAMEDVMHSVDACFMEVSLSTLDGIDVAKKIRRMGYKGEIIFLTNFEGAVFNAFDVGALDYIIKGKANECYLEKTFRRLIDKVKHHRGAYITFKNLGKRVNVEVGKIKYFESSNRLMTVHYGDESFEFYSTLKKIEKTLQGKKFERIHKSIIVNSSYVKERTSKEVKLLDGTVLPLGKKREYRTALDNEIC